MLEGYTEDEQMELERERDRLTIRKREGVFFFFVLFLIFKLSKSPHNCVFCLLLVCVLC